MYIRMFFLIKSIPAFRANKGVPLDGTLLRSQSDSPTTPGVVRTEAGAIPLLRQRKENAIFLPAGINISGIWLLMHVSAPDKNTATHVEKVGAPSAGGFSANTRYRPRCYGRMGIASHPR